MKGKVDTTLFTKYVDSDIFIVQIYINDIIFGSTNEMHCKDFESCMKKEFEMSIIGELATFLDSKSSKGVMVFSYTKPNTQESLSRNLSLNMQRQVRLPWLPQQSLTRMNKV